MHLIALLSLVLVAMASPMSRASDTDVSSFARAAGAYDKATEVAAEDPLAARALFADAAVAFDAAIADGVVHVEARRGQGNAWFLAGDVGRAILAYRRGLWQDPDDARTHEALQLARQSVRTATEPIVRSSLVDVLTQWRRFVSPMVVGMVFVGAWVFLWGMIVRGRMTGVKPRTVWVIGALALSLVSVTALIAEQRRMADHSSVVLIAQAEGFNGPSQAVYELSFEFPLSPGVEARAVESRSGWTHIRLASGSETWVPTDRLAWVNPSPVESASDTLTRATALEKTQP